MNAALPSKLLIGLWGLCVLVWLATVVPVVRNYVEVSGRLSNPVFLAYVLAPWCGAYFGCRAAWLLRKQGRRALAVRVFALALGLPPISVLLLPAIGFALSVALRMRS